MWMKIAIVKMDINLAVYVLIIIFNLSSWIDNNSIWAELPVLVNRLPEGWDLPTHMAAITNCAMLGVIVFMILKHIYRMRLKDWVVVYVIICGSGSGIFMVAFLWDNIVYIRGAWHSVFFMASMSLVSLVDKMSSVCYLSYMEAYKPQYLSAFFVGDGLCQLIPALLGLAQGVSDDPVCTNTTVLDNVTSGSNYTASIVVPIYSELRFSVTAFFIAMGCIIMCSGMAFTLLHFLPYCKIEQYRHNLVPVNETRPNRIALSDVPFLKEQDTFETVGPEKQNTMHQAKEDATRLSRVEFWLWMMVLSWGHGMIYSVLPTVQSYAALPYGNRAYSLSVRLGLAMNPLVSFLALFVSTRSKPIIVTIVLCGTVFLGYMTYLAMMSPWPPMKGEPMGEALVILASVMIVGCLNYARSCICPILQTRGGRGALMYGGLAMSVGGAIVSVVMLLINIVIAPFKSELPCVT